MMKKPRRLLWFLIFAALFSCAKEGERPKTEKAPGDEKTEQPGKAPPSAQTEPNLTERTIPPCRVAIMPIACVDGSYATANYQNRHFYPALTNLLLEIFGDIKTPRRQDILEKALEKKMITRQFYALRRKDHDLKEAAAFGREIDADFLVLPSLKGDDLGAYEFHVRIIKSSKEDTVLWEKSWNTQTQPYDYFATLKLYEDAAVATAEFFLDKKSPNWVASQGSPKAQNFLQEARDRQKSLLRYDLIASLHLLYKAVKEDPYYMEAWVALSETYSFFADHIINTNTEIARELALRAHLAAAIALRLNAVRPEGIRAALFSSCVNNITPLIDRYKASYMEKEPNSSLARFIASLDKEEAEKEKAFKEIASDPYYAVFFYPNLPEKIAFPVMTELYKKKPDSTFLCLAMVNLFLNDNFNTSADYSAYYTYLAQKQFLELYIPLLRSRDAGKADQLLDEIRQAVPANTPEKENEKKSWDLDQTLQNIAPYYRGYPRICYKDAPALKVLGTCSRILAEYESQIKEDSLKKQHFYDSLDLTERDEIALCQRELLRGPLNILYVVAQLLADKQVAPQIIPELEKMFPGDILVLRSGFTDIYWKTGFGPTGTYYLTKLNDRYLDNLDVQTFVQTNYLQAQKHPHNTTAARYFTYIASDPGNASVLSRAYNHLFRLKEMDLAGRVLNIHSRLFPQNDWPKKEALRIKRSDENRFNTREEIREVFPENIEGFYDIWNAASLYRSNGYFDEALKLFIRANEMAPGNSRLAQQLAWSWRLAGQPEKAFQIIENCAIKNGQSLTACYLFCSIAEDYFFTGDTEKARYYYIKANNIDPYFGMSNIGRGYLWYADGDQEKAKEQFKMYHERYQGPDGPVLMCRMLLKQDRVEEALECINQYMQDQDFRNNYLPHWIEAECVYRLGRTDEALKIIRGCADVMAGNMGARCDLAEMYLRIGKPEKAIEYLESEIKSRELGHDVLNPLYCTLISAYLEKNSPFDAIPYLHKCKFFMLDNAVSLSAIGLYEFETGKIDEARKYLESAIRVSPAFTFPRATMVFLETREGRIDQAIQVGEQGLKSCIFYDDTRLYYALSEAYLKKGESQKAAPLLERIVKVDGRMSRWGTRATNLLEKIPR